VVVVAAVSAGVVVLKSNIRWKKVEVVMRMRV
jgi:hypothetical protein